MIIKTKAKTYTGETDPKKFEGEFDIPMYVQDVNECILLFENPGFLRDEGRQFITVEKFYKTIHIPLKIKDLGRETIEVPR
ncbi:MAG: hypothetical protein IPL67_06320 [Ignavibacteria bacterium]|nr:hypothetical protein [Ignavibacteria bacterium]